MTSESWEGNTAALMLLLLHPTALREFLSYSTEKRTPTTQGHSWGSPVRPSWLECTKQRSRGGKTPQRENIKDLQILPQVFSWVMISSRKRPKVRERTSWKGRGLRAHKLPEIVPVSTSQAGMKPHNWGDNGSVPDVFSLYDGKILALNIALFPPKTNIKFKFRKEQTIYK